MDLPDRIRRYVAAMPIAVETQGGSNACLAVACVLIWGWDLSPAEAMPYLQEYSATCSPPWTEKELLHKLRSAEKKPPKDGKPRGHLLNARDKRGDGPLPPVAPAPKAERPREEWAKPDMVAIEKFCTGVPEIDTNWLRRRSPVDVTSVTSGAFFEALYQPGEKVLIFTRYYSQGDFVWWVGKGGFRLSDERQTRAQSSDLPKTGKLGAWYLVQPVTAQWAVGERLKEGVAKFTRRSEINVTRWVYFVLESDEIEPALWSKVVVGLRLPIVAMYSSGGRSLHALVKYEVASKAQWDFMKHQLERLVCPLGADPGALSAVRLSRVPGVFREGKEVEFTDRDGKKGKKYERFPRPRLQELVYLNPSADYTPIHAMPEVRR